MIKRTAVFVLAVFLFSATAAFAQSADTKISDILSKMETVDKTINTAEIIYTQEIVYTATNEKQNITGNLKYKKPGNVFIEQKTPQKQMVYIDGKKIIIYTPENYQAVADNWKDVISGDFAPVSLVHFGGNWKNMRKDNKISYSGEDEVYYFVDISPVNKNDWNMRLNVDKNSFLPKRAVVSMPGVNVNVDISDYKINPVLKKDIFKFTTPDGVELIELD